MLLVNESPYKFREGMRVSDVAAELKPDADLFIVNGYPAPALAVLEDGDSCWLIRKGEKPPADELERLLYARHSPGVHDKVKKSSVGIMGAITGRAIYEGTLDFAKAQHLADVTCKQ